MDIFKTNDKFYPFAVNKLGQVKDLQSGEIIECKIGTHGYRYKSRHLVHRMVAELFIPNPENKPQVNHKDSDRTNNNVSNLEWVTRSENALHMVKMGRNSVNTKRGEDNHLTVYSDELIHEICKQLESGIRSIDVAKSLDVPPHYVKCIKAGKIRKDITNAYDIQPFIKRVIPEDIVIWVSEKIADGVSNVKIARESNSPLVTEDLVKRIKYKLSYKDISDKYF